MTESDSTKTIVTDNPDRSQFELTIGDETAVAAYTRESGRITFTHTQVPESLEGQGYGTQLAKGALGKARAEGLKVVPRCAFIADFIEKNPEYADLVAPEN
ncbi:MAG: GNAT family N-acetyltransferase [Gemmatimonadaceae bacterium]